MQTITLNIGLNTNTGGHVEIHSAINRLEIISGQIVQSRVCQSPNGDDQVLVACIALPEDARRAIYWLCGELKQDCIAVVWGSGDGELIGPKAEEWGEFRPEFFVGIEGKPLVESPQPELEIDGFTRDGFANYLRFQLIPDLRSSGHGATADDFNTAAEFLTA